MESWTQAPLDLEIHYKRKRIMQNSSVLNWNVTGYLGLSLKATKIEIQTKLKPASGSHVAGRKQAHAYVNTCINQLYGKDKNYSKRPPHSSIPFHSLFQNDVTVVQNYFNTVRTHVEINQTQIGGCNVIG